MALASDLSALAATLLADEAVAALVGERVWLDVPGDMDPTGETYQSSNTDPFLYFGLVRLEPVGRCGGMRATLSIFAESFTGDRVEALTIIEAVIAALADRKLPSGKTLSMLRAGDAESPFSPFSAFAEFQFHT